MKVTNTEGLPEILVKMVSSQRKPKVDSISCTELIDSPAIHHMKLEHWDDLEVDASDLIAAGLGTAFHHYIETFANPTNSEVALDGMFGNFKITGTADYIEDGVITDWKTTRVWSVTMSDKWIKKVEEQLNVYCWMARQQGDEIKSLQALVVHPDWKRSEMMRSDNYPRKNWQMYKFNPWPTEKIEKFIADRIALFLDKSYQCSDDERWASPTTWAVMKEGRKSAVRVLPSSIEALAYSAPLDNKHTIVMRPGEHKRCEEYCSVRAVCPFKVIREDVGEEDAGV